ncbi:MAG: ABC transporter ATP-binding protein [Alphaproteobacteria bacterium]|nr:ABC transporter ATP-binding protein [Alphaproteobacteria bacterium]
MTALDANGVRVVRGGRAILDDFDIAVPENKLVALIGPNGAGKSTALRVLAGVLTPDAGAVRWLGRAADAWSRPQLARTVSYLPQQFRSHWDLSVAELLALGAARGRGFGWLQGLRRSALPDESVVGALELDGLLARRFASLSGGEQARAAFAMAMIARPPILLADEPAASLDVAHQLRLMRLIRSLSDTTVVVVLHDLNLAARFADAVVLLARGKRVLAGPADAVLRDPALDTAFDTTFTRLTVDGRLHLAPQ